MKIRAAEIPKQEGFSFGHHQQQKQLVTVGDSSLSAATASSMAEHKESDEQNQEEKQKEEKNKRVSDSPPTNESELRSSNPHHEAGPNLETLAVPSSLLLHHTADFQGSSTTDKGGKAENKLVGPTDKEIIVKEVKAPQMRKENQLQVSVRASPLSEPSISVEKSLSSAPIPTLPEQGLSRTKVNSVHMLEVDKKIPKVGKTLSSVSAARTSASDGYNWRKYGQKQVKSPTSSRSYYRCTHLDCCAKKIEWCDHSGQLMEIVYKSQHSHDPPRKIDSTRESKLMPSNEPTAENSVQEHPIRVLTDSDPSPSSKEPKQEAPCSADKKRQNSCNGENSEVILKEEYVNEPELKRRMKKDDLTCSESAVIPGKKSKFVVHAEGDVGISGDGYRWRKYGRKMVKGNPHPRNYYRCTSAGCPARKHIETAGDNSNAAIITYKGVHDHDMPVPKKRHGPPSAPLVAAAAPASMNNLKSTKSDSPQNQKTPTKWSVDTEGELTGEALDLGGEKALESARTLLSIGFEIKPC